MSDAERDDAGDEPLEVKTFVADEPELIDPHHDARNRTRPPRKWVPLILFVATCFSTFLIGSFGERIFDPPKLIEAVEKTGLRSLLADGLVYSVCVMSILLAHEMGHYLAAKFHRVPASLPYFIPMPFSPLGTMGAVIFQGRGVADRRQMFDIAIAGPLAGLVLALPVMWLGVQRAIVETSPDPGEFVFGMPLLVKWMFEYGRPEIWSSANGFADNPLLLAGWVGIFVTALNLIPIGQLDGGHILYCLIGKRAHKVAMALLLFAVAWMVYSGTLSYMLLVILLFLFGPRHPPTADDTVPLGWLRVLLGWLTLAFIVIGFTPNPIYQVNPEKEHSQPADGETAAHTGLINFSGDNSAASFSRFR